MQEARAVLHVSDDAHRRELLRVHSDNSLLQARSTSLQDSYFPKIYDEPKQVAPERVTGYARNAAFKASSCEPAADTYAASGGEQPTRCHQLRPARPSRSQRQLQVRCSQAEVSFRG